MPWKLNLSRHEAADQFAEYLEANGLDLRGASPRMDGHWYNVPLTGQRSGRSGGYMAYSDDWPVGFFALSGFTASSAPLIVCSRG